MAVFMRRCFCPIGFKEQIYDVYRYLPPATQVVLISATLPHEILEMTNKFMTDPIRILVKRLVRVPPSTTSVLPPELMAHLNASIRPLMHPTSDAPDLRSTRPLTPVCLSLCPPTVTS